MQGIQSEKLAISNREQRAAPKNSAPPSAQMLDLLNVSAPMVERRDRTLNGPTDSDGLRQTCLARLALIGVPIGLSAFNNQAVKVP